MIEAVLVFLLLAVLGFIWFRLEEIKQWKKVVYSVLSVFIFFIGIVIGTYPNQVAADLEHELERNEQLSTELSTMENNVEDLQSELDHLHITIEELNEEITVAVEENEVLQKNFDSTEEQNKTLTAQVEDLEEEKEGLQKEIEALEETVSIPVAVASTEEETTQISSESSESSS